MKRQLAFLLALMLLVSLSARGGKEPSLADALKQPAALMCSRTAA